MYRESNFNAPQAFLIKGDWIVDWWRKEKLGMEKAQDELARWKVNNCKRWVQEILWTERKRDEIASLKERFEVREQLKLAFAQFRNFPKINDWMQFYKRQHWGKLSRFRFLVLVGPSKMGKTNLALSLFGVHYTFVSQCTGTITPYLAGYSRRHHKAILLDEAQPELVLAHKQLFQANVDGALVGNSTTGCYANYYWLYQVPLIISTNRWFTEEELEKEDNKWLKENSIVVTITAPVWEGGDETAVTSI